VSWLFNRNHADCVCSAKHLRSKDRLLNGAVYPRVHYPEVYILEGGYCQYFKESGPRCQPPTYVRMDDPNYATSRKEDLDQFRKGKFGRTKSYAYGEGKNGLAAALQPPAQPKRNSAPGGAGGVNALFAAGNIARSRRTPGMLQTLDEDASGTQATDGEDEDTDIGDSPCPPPTRGVAFKGGKMSRMPLARAETYGLYPTTSAHHH
jgi:M-phase inducer tyrosine phosphatase